MLSLNQYGLNIANCFRLFFPIWSYFQASFKTFLKIFQQVFCVLSNLIQDYFVAKNTRQRGVVDTGVKTSEIGYMQRRHPLIMIRWCETPEMKLCNYRTVKTVWFRF